MVRLNLNPIAIVTGAIEGAVNRVVEIPTVPAHPSSAPVLTREIVQEVVPVVEHLTNAEPWYRSRVTWGAIVAMASGMLAIGGVTLSGEDQQLVVDLALAASTIFGAILTLYGRWAAKKPIGR